MSGFIPDVILTDLRSPYAFDRKRHILYYYKGNFFCRCDIHGGDVAKMKRAIRQFKKENAERVKADRADPDYKTLPELLDEQWSSG